MYPVENSLVVGIFCRSGTILLTEDQYFDEVKYAMSRLQIEKTLIFQFSHHGSKNSNVDFEEIIPSQCYIVSGTPMNDSKENTNGRHYKTNQSCQELMAERLMATRKNKSTYLVFTQPRLTKETEDRLMKHNVKIYKVDDFLGFSM